MKAFRALVVMGVSGCGKSTVALRLARELGWELAEADTFHSAANIEKMRSGTALTDEDRAPWLDAIASWIDARRRRGQPCIVACSALKRRYRERLAGGHADVQLVFLAGPYDTVAGRLAGRSGHYMPLSLLQSQFETLEPPGPEEKPIVLSIALPVDEIVREVTLELRRAASPS